MDRYQFFYEKGTLQIVAVYHGCKTRSQVWKNPATYIEVNVVDPPYTVTRDHKVVLGPEGAVVGTILAGEKPARVPIPGPAEAKKPWYRRLLHL